MEEQGAGNNWLHNVLATPYQWHSVVIVGAMLHGVHKYDHFERPCHYSALTMATQKD
jgi:hypothetical protein